MPAVGMIILAGGGKVETALRQRIGRGLRKKKSGPNIALVVDFADDFNAHTKGHAQQRLAIIKDTPGFAENVMPAGRDFDFVGLGLCVKIAARVSYKARICNIAHIRKYHGNYKKSAFYS